MTERPERPEPTEAAWDWMEARLGTCFDVEALEALRGDAPPEVLAALNAWKRWHVEHEAWRVAQPIDYDECGRWRMFGGPWLSWKFDAEHLNDGSDMRRAWACRQAIELSIKDGMPEEQLRALAGAIYEREKMRQHADAVLVNVLKRLGWFGA